MGALHFARPQLEWLLAEDAPRARTHLLLVGPPLTGKTYLLRRFLHPEDELARLVAGPDPTTRPPVRYLDCRLLESGAPLLGSSSPPVEEPDAATTPPVLLLDNFDAWLAGHQKGDPWREVAHLLRTVTLVATSSRPLRELGAPRSRADLDAFRQIFLHLLADQEVERVLRGWLATAQEPETLTSSLLQWIGGHPFLLARTADALADAAALLPPGQPLAPEHLPLLRLRLAEEHGRLLFDALWAEMEAAAHSDASTPGLMELVTRLLQGPVPLDALSPDQAQAMNWLLNRAMVRVEGTACQLFSPLWEAYLRERMAPQPRFAQPQTVVPETRGLDAQAFLAAHGRHFTPQERNLFLYFLERAGETVSVDELLEHIWRKPDGSARRVQEGIRRLRRRLATLPVTIGTIENDWGRGYRLELFPPGTAVATPQREDSDKEKRS